MITRTDEEVIKFILEYYQKTLFYPTYDEIAKGLYRTKSTIFTHMKKLEDEGIIVRKSEFSKQYRLLNADFIRRESVIE